VPITAPAVQGTALKIIKPDTTEPIPLKLEKQNLATIMIRFVCFLVIAIVILALAYLK
jgi:hypothetical protein